MWRYLRNIPPIEIDEFAAVAALEAIEWHLGYLADQMRETRDKVDRQGWAMARTQRFALDGLRRRIHGHLKEMGPTPHMAAAEIDTRLSAYASSLPQSDANADVLRAEREARTKAMAERKKGRGRGLEASRRMAGGKWARPRAVALGENLEQVGEPGAKGPATE